MCHLTFAEMYSPQYFFVNKISGSYSSSDYYDISLTCKPDPNYVGQGMLLDVPAPPNTNDTYYKIIPAGGRSITVTLTPYTGNDYNLYVSKTPNLFPFPEKSGTKSYVCYGDKAGYGGKEVCNLGVLSPGSTYYYLVHHAKGGYGYSVKWEYASPTTISTIPTIPPCLKEGTKVLTPLGLKAIEDLNVGDSVIGYKDGKKVETKVLAKMTHSGSWTIYYYKGSWFTGNHRVYPSLNDEAVEVQTLSSVSKQYTGKVYDIKTGTENYFGENDLLIHNKGGGGGRMPYMMDLFNIIREFIKKIFG
jgi:hypothetical protein